MHLCMDEMCHTFISDVITYSIQANALHQRGSKAIRLFQRRPWPIIDKLRQLMDFREENILHKLSLFVFPGIFKITFSKWDKYMRSIYGRVLI